MMDSRITASLSAAVRSTSKHFTLSMGCVSVNSELSLSSLLSQHLDLITPVGTLELQRTIGEAGVLPKILAAIFDADGLPLVLDHTNGHHLETKDRAILLAQGIAGTTAIVSRLCNHASCTPSDLARELRHFASSQERQNMLDCIAHSHLFSDCLMAHQLADLINKAALDVANSDATPFARQSLSIEDYIADPFGTYQRPARNMGLPWGFTIMAVN